MLLLRSFGKARLRRKTLLVASITIGNRTLLGSTGMTLHFWEKMSNIYVPPSVNFTKINKLFGESDFILKERFEVLFISRNESKAKK